MMNAYGSYTLLEAIGRKKNLKILLAHLVIKKEVELQKVRTSGIIDLFGNCHSGASRNPGERLVACFSGFRPTPE